jgi:hypothetical integral membrane protein (TIGR02206 family)
MSGALDAARPPFVPFGPAHLGAVLSMALVAVGLAWLVRARPGLSTRVRGGLFASIVALVGFELGTGAREGWLTPRMLLPLELCDAAMLLALVALVRPRPLPAEILYFWAGSGSLLAMVTPELPWGFPRWEFVVFFGLHGLVLAAAAVLVFGLGLRPRPGAPRRAFLATAGWAALAGAANLALGTNFMYLRRKPAADTPLDWMGPWPLYILTGAVVALVLFECLALPFRRGWSRRG